MLYWCVCIVLVIPANILNIVHTYPVQLQNGCAGLRFNQLNNMQIYDNGRTAQNPTNVYPSPMRYNLQTVVDPNTINACSYRNPVQNNQIPIYSVNTYPSPITYLKNDTSEVIIQENTVNLNASEKQKQRKKKRKSKTKKRVNDEESLDENNVMNDVDLIKSQYFSREKEKEPKDIQQERQINSTVYNKENVKENKNTKVKKKRKKPKYRIETNETAVETTECKTNIAVKSTSELNKGIKTKNEIEDNLNLMLLNEGCQSENRLIRNSNLEDNKSNLEVNDFSTKLPSTKDEVTNQFLNNLYENDYSLMVDWFNSYRKFYELLANQQIVSNQERKTKKRKSSKKNHKRKTKNNKNITEKTTIVNTKELTLDPITTTTTERIMYLSEQTESSVNSDETEKSSIFESKEKYPRNEMFENENSLNGYEERYDDGYYETYIDDYYPMFYDSAAYNANHKETVLKNLNDDKYYYATDRIGTEFNNYFQKNDPSRQISKSSNENKHTDDESTSNTVTFEDKKYSDRSTENQLEFRIPPLLETPDFITRQIDKSEMLSDGQNGVFNYDFNDQPNIGDKFSTYSKSKSPNFNVSKRNDIKVPLKDIETVYAKSKVVSYGRAPEEGSTSESSNLPLSESDTKSNGYQSDNIFYVIAESLSSQESNL